MKRRNFIRGLFGLALAPLALRAMPREEAAGYDDSNLNLKGSYSIRQTEAKLASAGVMPRDGDGYCAYTLYYLDQNGNIINPPYQGFIVANRRVPGR